MQKYVKPSCPKMQLAPWLSEKGSVVKSANAFWKAKLCPGNGKSY